MQNSKRLSQEHLFLECSLSSNVWKLVLDVDGVSGVYFVWRERNYRIHGKGDQNSEQVARYALDSVRMKLASIKFKKNARVKKLMETWKLSYGG